jgi:hypothetical protein
MITTLTQPTDDAPAVLAPTAELLRRLDEHGIRYCHWKGTVRLDRVLAGRGDLDLLVDPRDADAFHRIRAEAGFVATDPVRRDAPGEGHYFALDPDGAAVVHLHLHHDMPLSRSDPRGYRLPWTRFLLERRFRHSLGVWVPDAAVEFVVFAVRSSLSLVIVRRIRRGRHAGLDARRAAEFRWLASRVSTRDVVETGTEMVGAEAAALLAILAEDGTRADRLVHLRRRLMPPPPSFATRRGPAAAWRWTAEGWDRIASRLRRRLARPAPRPRRRTPPRGGALVAILGVDGSGKSTTMAELVRWLSPVVDVFPAYLGGGKRATSPLRRMVRLIHRGRKRMRPPGPSPYAHPGQGIVFEEGGGPKHWLRRLWFALWALSLAGVRARNMAIARGARERGMVVIADRFPQIQVAGLGDGVLLDPWLTHSSPLLRAAARRELRLFREATATPPDVAVILAVDLETARSRRPTSEPGLLRRKADAVDSLSFPPTTRVVRIDANRPLDQVLADVKQSVWREVLEGAVP